MSVPLDVVGVYNQVRVQHHLGSGSNLTGMQPIRQQIYIAYQPSPPFYCTFRGGKISSPPQQHVWPHRLPIGLVPRERLPCNPRLPLSVRD